MEVSCKQPEVKGNWYDSSGFQTWAVPMTVTVHPVLLTAVSGDIARLKFPLILWIRVNYCLFKQLLMSKSECWIIFNSWFVCRLLRRRQLADWESGLNIVWGEPGTTQSGLAETVLQEQVMWGDSFIDNFIDIFIDNFIDNFIGNFIRHQMLHRLWLSPLCPVLQQGGILPDISCSWKEESEGSWVQCTGLHLHGARPLVWASVVSRELWADGRELGCWKR